MSEKTTLGLNENVEGAVAYLLGPITGFALLILEKDNKFVRFHALQSIIVITALWILKTVVNWIPFLGGILSWTVGVASFVIAIVLIYNAFMGKLFKVPYVGNGILTQVYNDL